MRGGMAMFPPEIGSVLTNRQLMEIFHCACEGGIRYSSRTGTIVLVINNTKAGFPNIGNGKEIKFAGRPLKNGLSGVNKRLEGFLEEGKPVFLFEVNTPGQYRYIGPVRSAGPWQKARLESGLEYAVFPLKVGGSS